MSYYYYCKKAASADCGTHIFYVLFYFLWPINGRMCCVPNIYFAEVKFDCSCISSTTAIVIVNHRPKYGVCGVRGKWSGRECVRCASCFNGSRSRSILTVAALCFHIN